MLTIRMQRTGRKGHAMFRIVVQDSRRTPSSGKVAARLGHYDPHTKTVTLNKEKIDFYLKNGAQPSDRVAKILKEEGVKLPAWAKLSDKKESKVRNPEKLRKNRPTGEKAEAPATETTSEPSESEAADQPKEAEKPKETTPADTEAESPTDDKA